MAVPARLHVDVLVDGLKSRRETGRTRATLDAMPGITLTGKVDSIDPAGTSRGVVNYNVHANLDPTTEPDVST
jgi:hypothetical protein